ncbi:MAG: tRNA pseudouridine(38-40) synthase TruA, partial [Acidimicrobiia bacterium]
MDEGGPPVTLFDQSPAKLALLIAYDGTAFSGFAPQPKGRTVGGSLASALAKVLRHSVDLVCAGRTDAGVHAWGQVVSLEADPGVDPWRVRNSLNKMLGPEVVVRSCELAPPGFDARRSAVWRRYRYTILNRPTQDPFMSRYAWWVRDPLEIRAMAAAADPLLGEHDFAAFCRAGAPGSTTRRRVLSSNFWELGDGVLRYEITATAFCWQMVRSIVGTLVEVGAGGRNVAEVAAALRATDRASAGAVAPPH